MDERKHCNGARGASADRNTIQRLYERIARLHATIQELRKTGEELESDRQRLLHENRILRRKATLSNLLEDLESSIGTVLQSEDSTASVAPPLAERLYRQLPDRFSFPVFFQLVADEGLETETARRYLVHYLGEGRLVQKGPYLEKENSPSGEA